jgi:hypothetical protein
MKKSGSLIPKIKINSWMMFFMIFVPYVERKSEKQKQRMSQVTLRTTI